MDKLSFPKGSLKFKKIEKTKQAIPLTWPNFFFDMMKRKNYMDIIEKNYPGKAEQAHLKMPPEIIDNVSKVASNLASDRKVLKDIPDFEMKSDYEITFTHPKWSKYLKTIEEDAKVKFGSIVVLTKGRNIKESIKEIHKKFIHAKKDYRALRIKEKCHDVKSLKTVIKYKVSGGCIYMPEVKEGVYLKFLKDQEKRIVFSNKSPKDANNYVGVELEFLCKWDKEKLGFELFDKGLGKLVTLTEDGSIKCCPKENKTPDICAKHIGKLHAHELCVLVKENNYKDIMKTVCEVLAKCKAVVNKSCGMHVHLDMRNRDAEKAYQNLLSSQTILFKMNPKSRAERWAKRVTNRDFEEMKNTPQTGMDYRYLSINPVAMHKHTTIEIRIHSGTIEYNKIVNWIEILLSVANTNERIIKNFTKISTFSKSFSVNKDLQKYIQERMDKFEGPLVNGIIIEEVQPEEGAA